MTVGLPAKDMDLFCLDLAGVFGTAASAPEPLMTHWTSGGVEDDALSRLGLLPGMTRPYSTMPSSFIQGKARRESRA